MKKLMDKNSSIFCFIGLVILSFFFIYLVPFNFYPDSNFVKESLINWQENSLSYSPQRIIFLFHRYFDLKIEYSNYPFKYLFFILNIIFLFFLIVFTFFLLFLDFFIYKFIFLFLFIRKMLKK